MIFFQIRFDIENAIKKNYLIFILTQKQIHNHWAINSVFQWKKYSRI